MNYGYIHEEEYNGYTCRIICVGQDLKSGNRLSDDYRSTFGGQVLQIMGYIRSQLLQTGDTGFTNARNPIRWECPSKQELLMDDTYNVDVVVLYNEPTSDDLQTKRTFYNRHFDNLPRNTFGNIIRESLSRDLHINFTNPRYRLVEIVVFLNHIRSDA